MKEDFYPLNLKKWLYFSPYRYYCLGNNTEPNPSAYICPIGNYCPEGSYLPTPCPSGTMAVNTGNVNVTNCEICSPGRYCTTNSSKNGE